MPNQTQFAAILSEKFQELVYTSLAEEYKKEYDDLKDREFTQQMVSDWELGAETPKLIAYLAAQFFKIDVEWLTDYIFETFESPGYVQTGGSSINYWNTIHTQTVEIKNDPEPLVEGFRGLMQTQKEYYEERIREKDITK
ncbi:MAG: hypothetical protein LUG96_01930 [Tannerellaceae bacterium]|nr:hypothetical protein [Tannerellaceae bacterium]